MTTSAGRISLATVLICATVTFGAGVAWKSYCAGGDWGDARQYTTACYSDIIPLLGAEQLTSSRLPYIDACAKSDGNCDEYPVLSMYFMRIAASLSGPNPTAFFWTNVVMLWICAMVVVACCYFVVGSRALYVALAPTLLLSGVLNWDLLAIALSMAGVLYFFTRREVESGAYLGLGAAAKFFPVLLVIPLAVDRIRSREPDRGITIAWSAGAAWFLANIPFALLGLTGWLEFFRFNSTRGADYDSLWYIGYRLSGGYASDHTALINLASAGLFVGLVGLVWAIKAHRHPAFPRWTLGFPILALFLLTNKVYSPQYSLWLIPWFALALPRIWEFAAFQVADVLVYVARFRWFGTLPPYLLAGPSEAMFEFFVVVRAAVLLGCVIGWLLYEAAPLPIQLTLAAAEADPHEAEPDPTPLPA